jgi:ATP-binding cassette subfamily C protein
MKLLLAFARAYPRRTALTMLCLVLAGLAEGVGVSVVLPLVRLAVPGGDGGQSASQTQLEQQILQSLHTFGLSPNAQTLFAFIIVGLLLKATLMLVANRQVGYAVAQMTTSLRLQLIRALLATRWLYYVHQPVGVVATSVALEAQSAGEAYLRAATILAFLLQALIYTIVACLISWRAALGALAGGTIIIFTLHRLVRLAHRAGTRQTKLTRSLLARLTDTLQSVKPLKAMAREPLITPVLEKETIRLNRALEREVISRAALDSLQEPLLLLFVAVSLYGALTVLRLTLADMAMMAFLATRVLGSLGRVQKEFQRLAARESAFWALRDLIRQAEAAVEVLPGGRVPSLRREIRLTGVGFTYERERVLDDASLVIPAGDLTVITGPSGGGKTTLADLVIGLLQPVTGVVLIDGVPLQEIEARRWRAMIGYVPQETLMLHASVAENVTLGDPEVSRDDTIAALRAAGAWEFVDTLPQGIDTLVGERGLRLSGGQRQRLALARALVRKPALLVLDEATTALDPANEREICETLLRLRGAMTLLAICHHGHLVDIADHVYRVSHGKIEAVRPHAVPGALGAVGN